MGKLLFCQMSNLTKLLSNFTYFEKLLSYLVNLLKINYLYKLWNIII